MSQLVGFLNQESRLRTNECTLQSRPRRRTWRLLKLLSIPGTRSDLVIKFSFEPGRSPPVSVICSVPLASVAYIMALPYYRKASSHYRWTFLCPKLFNASISFVLLTNKSLWCWRLDQLSSVPANMNRVLEFISYVLSRCRSVLIFYIWICQESNKKQKAENVLKSEEKKINTICCTLRNIVRLLWKSNVYSYGMTVPKFVIVKDELNSTLA